MRHKRVSYKDTVNCSSRESELTGMDELMRNRRRLIVATVIMLLVTAVFIVLGGILFPLSAFKNPGAGAIHGLTGFLQGIALVIVFLGALATNIGVYLANVIRLERERNDILARNIEANFHTVEAVTEHKAPDDNTEMAKRVDSIFRPQK